MATSDHIRAQKRPLSRPRPAAQKNSGTRTLARPGQRKSGQKSAKAQDLGLTVLRLRAIQATVVTATAALQKQNADLDADIALTLRHAVTNPLAAEIERLEALLGNAKEALC